MLEIYATSIDYNPKAESSVLFFKQVQNKIVTAYLDIAEVRALAQEPMYMKDWLETIDDYLKMTRRDILVTKGKVTHKQAIEKAHKEYEKYVSKYDEQISPVEKHFIESINELEGLL